MEKDFNPIRDLRSPEVDPFNVPAGQSTQEIEAIRLTLVVTREKTENLVKLLKRKGLIFKQDVEKIKELQRRLRKTIPRIPILRDDSITGTETSMDDSRRSRFDVMRGFRKPPKTPTPTSVPVANPFPFFEVVVAIASITGIRGIKMPKFIKNLFGKSKGKGTPSTIDDILKQLDDQIKGPITIDDILKKLNEQIEELIKKRKVVPTSLINLQKNLQRVQQNQTTASRMSSAFDKNRGKITSGKKFANNKKIFEKELKKLEKGISEDQIIEFLNKSNITSPKLLKTRLNQGYKADADRLAKSLESGKITPGKYAEELLNLQTRYDKFLLELDVYVKDVEDIVGKYLRYNLYQKYKQPLPKSLKQSNKEINEFIKQNVSPDSPLYKFQKGKSKVQLDGKPMSNDIAMLNTDTRDRETIVIITDSIA